MRRFRRWLAFLTTSHRDMSMDEPTNITATFPLDRADDRRHKMMHLHRGNDALVIPTIIWELAVVLAASDGGWKPLGTDAPAQDFGGEAPANAGHYIACGQTTADSDAKACAAGLRQAQRNPGDVNVGAAKRKVPLGWWMASDGSQADRWTVDGQEKFVGVNAPAMAQYFNLWDVAEQIASFLDGGSCRIMPGLPKKVLDDDAEHARIEKLRREEAALQRQLEESAEAKLQRVRAELAAAL